MSKHETPEAEPAAAGKGRSKALSLIVAVAFVLLIVLVECAVAMMLFPSAEEIAALNDSKLAASEDHENPEHSVHGATEEDEGETKEIEVGQFGVAAYKAVSNSTIRIDLHLFAVVESEHETELSELLTAHENRIREQVLMILRSAEMTDLNDSGLGLIKRKILEKTNRTIGQNLIREIVFSDVSVMEM